MSTTVELKLYATLKRHMPDDGNAVPIAPGITVAALLQTLNVDLAAAKLVFINGRKATVDTPLSGGERIGVFPPVGGG